VTIVVDGSLTTFNELATNTEVFKVGPSDYRFFDAVSYSSDKLPAQTKFIKILLNEGIQIARVEISYSPIGQVNQIFDLFETREDA
jgi:hypothetical protein